MSGFFVVKGELAAWALGLDQDEVLPTEDAVLLRPAVEEAPKRRKRRLGHEHYRQLPVMLRRELSER
jgi:hypothetical protein